MNRLKTFALASALAFVASGFAPTAKADEWNKKTIITVNEPLALPGTVLQPGKYVLKLMDSPAERHIVQVFNQDETQLIDTVMAIPNYRLQPTDKTQFAYWEMPTGQPRALKAWFYPGDNFGQEFAYPKDLATTIAQKNNENVPTVTENNNVAMTTPSGETQAPETQPQQSASSANSTTTTTPTPAPSTNNEAANNNAETAQPQQNNETAQNNTANNNAMTQPAAPPAPTTPPAQTTNQAAASTTQTASNNLPRTASPYPLAGLAGLIALGAALALRAARRA